MRSASWFPQLISSETSPGFRRPTRPASRLPNIRRTEDDETIYAAGLLAGVDTQVPTITFTSTSPKADATALREFQVHVADEGSGIREENDPVSMTAEVRNEDGTEKVKDLKLEISLPLATTQGHFCWRCGLLHLQCKDGGQGRQQLCGDRENGPQ